MRILRTDSSARRIWFLFWHNLHRICNQFFIYNNSRLRCGHFRPYGRLGCGGLCNMFVDPGKYTNFPRPAFLGYNELFFLTTRSLGRHRSKRELKLRLRLRLMRAH